jgi:hypothetical protein
LSERDGLESPPVGADIRESPRKAHRPLSVMAYQPHPWQAVA